MFNRALRLAPGVPGSLYPEVRDIWQSLQGKPGTIPERHALGNMTAPRDAQYEHVVKFDDGAALQKIRACFHTQQNKKQTIGLSEDEMLLKFYDDKDKLQKAIDKGKIRVHGRLLLL